MTTYYVDPDTGDNVNAGTSTGEAWATIQYAEDNTGAGDIIYLLHGAGNDEAPAAIIDFDGTAGDQTDGWKQFIGVGALWADDGTRYVIQGGNIAADAIFNFTTNRNYFYYFKNIELKEATAASMKASTSFPKTIIFDNCYFNDPATSGLNTYIQYVIYFRCRFESCGARGIYRPWHAVILFCQFIDNTTAGLQIYHTGTIISYGNIFHGNGSGIIEELGQSGMNIHINSVMDGNTTDGIQVNAGGVNAFVVFLGNRLTNNGAFGLDDNDDGFLTTELYNFFLNNVTAAIDGTKFSPLSGRGSLTAGTEGYTNKGSHDFSLADTATLRRTAIALP